MMGLALVLAVAGTAPSGALPVRLAPVTCPGFPDAGVRAALAVEIRDRLVAEATPTPPDFALVSVACARDDAELLIVRQGSGVPVRRQVPLAAVAPDARPRAMAIAIAELLRVDLARNEPVPEPAPAPPPAPAPAPRKVVVTFDGAPFVFGWYSSGDKQAWTTGLQLRFAFLRPTETVPRRNSAWGVALGFDEHGPDAVNRFVMALGASALIRRRQDRFIFELGLGGRFGTVSDYTVNASPASGSVYGPFGSLAVETPLYKWSFSRLAVEAGADGGPFADRWARLVLGGGGYF